MTRDDAREFPRSVVVGLDLTGFPSPDQGLGKEGRLGVRDGDRSAGLRGCGQGLRAGEGGVASVNRRRAVVQGGTSPQLLYSLRHRTCKKDDDPRQAISFSLLRVQCAADGTHPR